MWKTIVVCCVALLLAVGCAEIPRPSTYPASLQQHVQSATHWQSQARLTVERLSANANLPEIFKSHYKTYSPRVYVQANDRSSFDVAFRKYLITELVNAGYGISGDPDSPVRIYWDFQLVDRNKDRWKPGPGVPEFIAEAAVWLLTGIRWNTTDLWAPNTELILTTRFTIGDDKPQNIVPGGVYSDTFYINNDDWTNYWALQDAYPGTIGAKEEAWKRRLDRQGLLSHPSPKRAVAQAAPVSQREEPPPLLPAKTDRT